MGEQIPILYLIYVISQGLKYSTGVDLSDVVVKAKNTHIQ